MSIATGPNPAAISTEIRHLDEGRTAIVRVSGDIDLSTADHVRRSVDRALAYHPEHLVVDLTETPFLDSTGLGIMAGAWSRLHAEGGDLTVVTPSPRLAKHFAITGLDQHIRLTSTLGDALGGLRHRS